MSENQSSFKQIKVWLIAKDLCIRIYATFSHLKDRSFRDQITRASVSTMSNISEGYDRDSHRDFIRYLIISRGSNNEVRSLLDLAINLAYIDKEQFEVLDKDFIILEKMISSLINKIKIKSETPKI